MSRQQKKSGSSSRKLRRAHEAIQRKAPKLNGQSRPVTADEVNAVVQQLNDNQQTLGKLVNQTNNGVLKAFTIQDGHLHVQRRIFNDMAKDLLKDGCEGTLKVLDDGSINWEWYFREYELMKVAVAFAMWIKKITAGDPVQEEDTLDEEVGDADMVFGGDYGSSAHSSEG